MRSVTHALVLMALGDALMGSAMAQSLELPRTAARDTAEAMLIDGAIKAGIVVPGQVG
jgi:dihydroxyacetone kinase DhaKLM complex PTS-EIIA-like component DhaM